MPPHTAPSDPSQAAPCTAGQEKTFHCKERASAESPPPTTLPTAKHFKTKTNKYTEQAPVLQKEKKSNPTAEFQRQLCSSFSLEQRLPQHLTRSLAARRRGPHPSLSQPLPAWHRAHQNRLSFWLSSPGQGPASVLTKNCFLLLGYPSRMASSSSVAWRDRAREGCGQRSQRGRHRPPAPQPVPSASSGATPGGTAAAPGTPANSTRSEPPRWALMSPGQAMPVREVLGPGRGPAQTGPGFRHSSYSPSLFPLESRGW